MNAPRHGPRNAPSFKAEHWLLRNLIPYALSLSSLYVSATSSSSASSSSAACVRAHDQQSVQQ
eukprot:16097-Heterococcus_DN1.PRE.2